MFEGVVTESKQSPAAMPASKNGMVAAVNASSDP